MSINIINFRDQTESQKKFKLFIDQNLLCIQEYENNKCNPDIIFEMYNECEALIVTLTQFIEE